MGIIMIMASVCITADRWIFIGYPLTASYLWFTQYQFAGIRPIAYVDIDGLEDRRYIFTWTKDGTVIGLSSWNEGKVASTDKSGVSSL